MGTGRAWGWWCAVGLVRLARERPPIARSSGSPPAARRNLGDGGGGFGRESSRGREGGDAEEGAKRAQRSQAVTELGRGGARHIARRAPSPAARHPRRTVHRQEHSARLLLPWPVTRARRQPTRRGRGGRGGREERGRGAGTCGVPGGDGEHRSSRRPSTREAARANSCARRARNPRTWSQRVAVGIARRGEITRDVESRTVRCTESRTARRGAARPRRTRLSSRRRDHRHRATQRARAQAHQFRAVE